MVENWERSLRTCTFAYSFKRAVIRLHKVDSPHFFWRSILFTRPKSYKRARTHRKPWGFTWKTTPSEAARPCCGGHKCSILNKLRPEFLSTIDRSNIQLQNALSWSEIIILQVEIWGFKKIGPNPYFISSSVFLWIWIFPLENKKAPPGPA